VPVKNEQVRLLLLNIEHNATQLVETTPDEHKLSLYESMMKTLVEAQQILRDEYKDDPVIIIIIVINVKITSGAVTLKMLQGHCTTINKD